MIRGGLHNKELRFQGLVWHVAASHLVAFGKWLSVYFPGVFEKPDCLMKSDVGTRVAAAAGLVIKESTPRRGRAGPRFSFRRSASRRAFELATSLLRGGVRTPHPVAWITVRRMGLRIKDYLVTEQIVPSSSLRSAMELCRDVPADRRRLMVALGRLLASFHVAGYSNRDLKDTNILVAGADPMELWAVDMDGVRKALISRRRAVKDLWPIVRSLKMYGLGNAADKAAILEGYNAAGKLVLKLEDLPATY
jgi:hypothetical protein